MKRSTIWEHKYVKAGISTLFWLAVWQTVSLFAPKILFSSPVQTVRALLRMVQTSAFWISLGVSFGKIVIGFALALLLAAALAILCRRWALFRALVAPMIQFMKSVPVACFVIIALIWMRSAWLSVLVSLFVVLPVLFIGFEQGMDAIDPTLTEMAQVFRVPRGRKLVRLYLPQMIPSVAAHLRLAIGMCWKAGIAGEVIGLPDHSVGEQLYLTKLYLSVDELFAWIIVILAVSLLCEKLLGAALKRWEVRYANRTA